MVIELIGLPGSGKTMIRHAIAEYFYVNGMDVFSNREVRRMFGLRFPAVKLVSLAPRPLQDRILNHLCRYYRRLARKKFEESHSMLIESVMRYQKSRPMEAVAQRNVLPAFMKASEAYVMLAGWKRPADIHIFDEGFIHRVVALFVSAIETPDPARVKEYIDLVPGPDCVIYIKASPEACMWRRKENGLKGYLGTLDEDSLASFFANAQAVIALTVRYVKEKGWKVIEIDNNTADPSRAVHALRKELAGMMASKF